MHNRSKVVRLFVVSFEKDGQRMYWAESMSANQAFALGKSLAGDGLKPRVHKINASYSSLDRVTLLKQKTLVTR
jgi:hypothetical protein